VAVASRTAHNSSMRVFAVRFIGSGLVPCLDRCASARSMQLSLPCVPARMPSYGQESCSSRDAARCTIDDVIHEISSQ